MTAYAYDVLVEPRKGWQPDSVDVSFKPHMAKVLTVKSVPVDGAGLHRVEVPAVAVGFRVWYRNGVLRSGVSTTGTKRD